VSDDVLGIREFEGQAGRTHVLSSKAISGATVPLFKVPQQVLSLFLEIFEVGFFW
jgi:hypothetical protein